MAAAARRFASLLAEVDEDEVKKPPSASTAPAEVAAAESKGESAAVAAETKNEPAAADKCEKETRKMMKKRHEKELAEVEEQCRQKTSESKKKNKLIRETVQAECAELKRACVLRHEKELSTLPPDDSDEPDLAEDVSGLNIGAQKDKESGAEEPAFGYKVSDKKKGKQQKRKEAKAADEARRYQEAKDSMKDWVDPKDVEDRALQAKLAPLKLRIHPIPSDGNCMYRAISDQCKIHHLDADEDLAALISKDWLTYTQLRRKAADLMRRHPDDFVPFIIDEDIPGAQDGDMLSAYLQRLTDTSEWGGNLELIALARALPAHIHVHSAAADEHVFSPDGPCKLHLHLSFHRHAFGLGEHYNSLHPAE